MHALFFLLLILFATATHAAEITLHEEIFTVKGRITAVEPEGKRWQLIVKPESIDGLEGDMPRNLRLMFVKPTTATTIIRCPPEDTTCLAMPPIIIPPIGMMVEFRSKLKRPAPPAYPNGFDWQLWLYDRGVDATGFVLGQFTQLEAPPPSWLWQQWFRIQQTRLALSQRLYYGLEGTQEGGMAAALVAGTQGYLNKHTETIMRLSGLTHIISISGMHMTMIAGFAYAVFRYVLVLTPFALRFPIKKWAALFALGVSFAYLLISGLSIPAQRSFMTTAVFFTAILLDRKPFSLWTLFLAACVIICIDWHAVFNPGFQMSFLAVLTLILFYNWWSAHNWQEVRWKALKIKPLRHFVGMFLSTIAVTLTGAPVTAYHFGTIALYGAISNLIAIPLSGLVLMPALGITVLLMPFDLEHIPLTLAGYAITSMFTLAEFIATLKGAQVSVPTIPFSALCLLFLGLCAAFYARRIYKLSALVFIGASVFLIVTQPKPLFLLSANRQQFGVIEGDALTIYSLKRDTFLQERWEQYLGIPASKRIDVMNPEKIPPQAECAEGTCVISTNTIPPRTVKIVFLQNNALDCGQTNIVIAPFQELTKCSDATIVDATLLQGQGSAAFFISQDGSFTTITDLSVRGKKPWAYYE